MRRRDRITARGELSICHSLVGAGSDLFHRPLVAETQSAAGFEFGSTLTSTGPVLIRLAMSVSFIGTERSETAEIPGSAQTFEETGHIQEPRGKFHDCEKRYLETNSRLGELVQVSGEVCRWKGTVERR